jgi:hypothetical protein
MPNLGLLTANASRRGSDAHNTVPTAHTNYQHVDAAPGRRFRCCGQYSTHTHHTAELHLLLRPKALDTGVCLSLWSKNIPAFWLRQLSTLLQTTQMYRQGQSTFSC